MQDTQDISDLRKQLEEAKLKIDSLSMENRMLKVSLSESDKLHQSIVEHSLDGTIIINKELLVVYANDEIFNISGYGMDTLYEKNILEFVHPKHKDLVKSELEKHFKDPQIEHRFEFDIIKDDGDIKNTYVSCAYVDDFQSSTALILQMLDVTDIKKAERRMIEINKELEQRVTQRTEQLESAMTELKVEIAVRKKAEEDLKRAKEEVQSALDKEKELNQLKTRFISMISHEYRTPLTVILTSSYLVEQFYEGTNKEHFDKFLGKIRNSVESMTQLLEDVLKIGKSEAGKLNLEATDINILAFIDDILDEIKVVDKGKHEFDFNYTIDNTHIMSDEKSLRHILQNLIGNAAKYSPDADKVKITLVENPENYVLKIQDYGIGIPEKDQELLFQTFHRASNVGAIQGTGLGLAIVKKSCEALGGSISLTSEEGIGTTFTITLLKDIRPIIALSTN